MKVMKKEDYKHVYMHFFKEGYLDDPTPKCTPHQYLDFKGKFDLTRTGCGIQPRAENLAILAELLAVINAPLAGNPTPPDHESPGDSQKDFTDRHLLPSDFTNDNFGTLQKSDQTEYMYDGDESLCRHTGSAWQYCSQQCLPLLYAYKFGGCTSEEDTLSRWPASLDRFDLCAILLMARAFRRPESWFTKNYSTMSDYYKGAGYLSAQFESSVISNDVEGRYASSDAEKDLAEKIAQRLKSANGTSDIISNSTAEDLWIKLKNKDGDCCKPPKLDSSVVQTLYSCLNGVSFYAKGEIVDYADLYDEDENVYWSGSYASHDCCLVWTGDDEEDSGSAEDPGPSSQEEPFKARYVYYNRGNLINFKSEKTYALWEYDYPKKGISNYEISDGDDFFDRYEHYQGNVQQYPSLEIQQYNSISESKTVTTKQQADPVPVGGIECKGMLKLKTTSGLSRLVTLESATINVVFDVMYYKIYTGSYSTDDPNGPRPLSILADTYHHKCFTFPVSVGNLKRESDGSISGIVPASAFSMQNIPTYIPSGYYGEVVCVDKFVELKYTIQIPD